MSPWIGIALSCVLTGSLTYWLGVDVKQAFVIGAAMGMAFNLGNWSQ